MNKPPAAKVTQLSLEIIYWTNKNKNHNSDALISIFSTPLIRGICGRRRGILEESKCDIPLWWRYESTGQTIDNHISLHIRV